MLLLPQPRLWSEALQSLLAILRLNDDDLYHVHYKGVDIVLCLV
jgi:hypothetical protein